MPTYSFRLACTHEAGQIADLINAAYRGETSRKGWTTEADLLDGARTDSHEVAALIAKQDSLFLLCMHDSRLLGCLHVEKTTEKPIQKTIEKNIEKTGEETSNSAHLGMFVIHPDMQGQGLGKQLLNRAEALVSAQWQSQRCVMHVITLRQELIEFYRRRGYRLTGQIGDFPLNPDVWTPKLSGLKLAVLEKWLSPLPQTG